MATQAHCAYCFESLSASLQKRSPLDLPTVLRLWKLYNSDPDEEALASADAPLDDDDVDEDEDEEMADELPTDPTTAPRPFRPAAVSRLLAPSPSSASSSSVQSTSSTPSGLSEASSATSKSSSRSSLFSPGRRGGKEERRSSEKADEHPLFVTWNTIGRNGGKSLRGCIGTFEPQELGDGLRSYALTSAFDDTRFSPITLRELPSLECGVTLLTNFEPIASPLDWEIGLHGLRISFTYYGRRYGSTYLPDVAREQGWTKEETMVSLMRKAGWSGRKDEWTKVPDLNVIRYQGRQVKLGYREWKEWRDWVEEQE